MPIVKPNNTGGFVKIQQSHRSYEGGNFLILVVNVAKLEEHLSSDLLNHFVIVQKVFRSEVKEVISKVSENSAPNGWNIVQSTAGKPPESTLRSFGSERGSNPRPADEIFGDSPPFMLQAKFVMDVSGIYTTEGNVILRSNFFFEPKSQIKVLIWWHFLVILNHGQFNSICCCFIVS